MGANACDDVFGWAERDPGRAMFAAQAGKYCSSAGARRQTVNHPASPASAASRADLAAATAPSNHVPSRSARAYSGSSSKAKPSATPIPVRCSASSRTLSAHTPHARQACSSSAIARSR